MSEVVTTCSWSEEWLGALVLGALEPAERDEAEAHVRRCAACSAILAELAPLPGLLHRADLAATQQPPPPELLDRALATAGTRQGLLPLRGGGPLAPRWRRRRRLVLLGAALAAAATVAAVLLAWTGARPTPVVVSATSATTHVSARVVVTPVPAGTQLALTLQGVTAGEHCQLVAVGRDGTREVAATWVADYEGQATVTGTTSLTRADLARLEVSTPDGSTLVEVAVPA